MRDETNGRALRVKSVQLLDCTPGNQGNERGDATTIITLGCYDDIEPLMIDMRDTRELAARCLASLAAHGIAHDGPQPDRPVLPPESLSTISKRFIPPDPRQPGKLTLQKASFVKFTVLHEDKSRNVKRVIGGYTDKQDTYVLFRSMGRFAIDSIARILPAQRMILGDRQDSNCLMQEDWGNFIGLWEGAQFAMNGKRWKKLSLDELCRLVSGRTFRQYVKRIK